MHFHGFSWTSVKRLIKRVYVIIFLYIIHNIQYAYRTVYHLQNVFRLKTNCTLHTPPWKIAILAILHTYSTNLQAYNCIFGVTPGLQFFYPAPHLWDNFCMRWICETLCQLYKFSNFPGRYRRILLAHACCSCKNMQKRWTFSVATFAEVLSNMEMYRSD